jgi:hypothetical protein
MSEANGEDVVLDDWAKSKTKAILESMIIKGEIPEEDWPPASVYELKDEFKKTHYKRQFVSGLRRLRKEIKMRKVSSRAMLPLVLSWNPQIFLRAPTLMANLPLTPSLSPQIIFPRATTLME